MCKTEQRDVKCYKLCCFLNKIVAKNKDSSYHFGIAREM